MTTPLSSFPRASRGLVAHAVRLLIAATFLQAAPLALMPAFAQGEPITLNFANADIEAVARTMAVVTGRDVVVDPRVKGTMNLVTVSADAILTS